MGKPKPSTEALAAWVDKGLSKPMKSNTELATLLGIDQPRVSEMRKGKRRVQAHELPLIAQYIEEPLPDEFAADIELPRERVPIVGYVGAGAEMHLYALADNPDEFVPMPPGGNEHTVAVEVRGSSLGSFFDRWLVYYDQRRFPPTPDLMRQLCVVELADGRVLVKKLRKGSEPGLYNLESQTEGLIEDVSVVWAAKVKHMTPR